MDRNRELALNASNSLIKTLGAITLLLVLASIAGQLFEHFTGHVHVYGLLRLFDLDEESNIPTFHSALLLLLAALLLAIIGVLKKRSHAPYSLQWSILALLFMYLAVDEVARFHELLGRPAFELMGGGAHGIFYRTWVIPAIAFLFLLALFYLRFLLHLPKRTKLLFCLAAILYIGGAVGAEMIGGWYGERYGFDTFIYIALVTLEESLEMAGVIVFIHALLTYIETHYGQIRLCLIPLSTKPQDRKM